MKELITYVKANKDKVTYANAGVGSASHLCGMLFMTAIQTDVTTVPYKGTGPAMNDLLGGQVDFMCDQTTNTTGQIKGGKVKVYAVTTPKRVPSLPDVPTMQESGLRRLRRRGVARPVRAEGHAEARDRQARRRAADRAQGSERQGALRRARHRAGAGGPGDAGCAAQAPEGADRPVESDHQEGGVYAD